MSSQHGRRSTLDLRAIRQWTTRQLLTRAAYEADKLRAEGLCTSCGERPRASVGWECTRCRVRTVKRRRMKRAAS